MGAEGGKEGRRAGLGGTPHGSSCAGARARQEGKEGGAWEARGRSGKVSLRPLGAREPSVCLSVCLLHSLERPRSGFFKTCGFCCARSSPQPLSFQKPEQAYRSPRKRPKGTGRGMTAKRIEKSR